MGTAAENAAFIRRYLDSANERIAAAAANAAEGAPPATNPYISDDIVVRYPGQSSVAGTYRGMGEFKQFGARWMHYATTIHEPVDILASDDRVCILVNERLEKPNGESIEFLRTVVYRIDDGKMVEMTIFDENQPAMDQFLDS